MPAVLAQEQYIGTLQRIRTLPGTRATQQRTVERLELRVLLAFIHVLSQAIRHIEASDALFLCWLEDLHVRRCKFVMCVKGEDIPSQRPLHVRAKHGLLSPFDLLCVGLQVHVL